MFKVLVRQKILINKFCSIADLHCH